MNLSYQFEELPDFWEGGFRSGSHNGTAEIHVNADGSWIAKSITLDCHNGQCGPSAQSKTVELSRTYQSAMFEALSDALQHFCGAHIEDQIEMRLAEAA